MFAHRSLGWESIRYGFAPLCEGLLQRLIPPLSAPNHFHELPPHARHPANQVRIVKKSVDWGIRPSPPPSVQGRRLERGT
jgi:hypothetical protein